MIFLTVGTWYKGFDRLVKAVDELVGSGIIDDQVIAQIGYSSYKPNYLKTFDFCSLGEFKNLISKAKLIISHAGIGTIAQSVEQYKPAVVVPRKVSLGEVDNDHQYKTAKQLEIEGKVLVAYEVSNLPEKIKHAETFVPIRDGSPEKVLHTVKKFIDSMSAKNVVPNGENGDVLIHRIWPYKILLRNDEDIKVDLKNIMQHFTTNGQAFDTIVFVPNAGSYLSELFTETFNGSFNVNFVKVQRASTVLKSNFAKKFVFQRKRLSNIMRHFEVLLRLMKYKLGIRQKMVAELEIDFDAANKRILAIDDSVDTGTTLRMVKSALLEKGAQSVTTACISNHLLPDEVHVDYSVYRYRLLRTKNSRDCYATI